MLLYVYIYIFFYDLYVIICTITIMSYYVVPLPRPENNTPEILSETCKKAVTRGLDAGVTCKGLYPTRIEDTPVVIFVNCFWESFLLT